MEAQDGIGGRHDRNGRRCLVFGNILSPAEPGAGCQHASALPVGPQKHQSGVVRPCDAHWVVIPVESIEHTGSRRHYGVQRVSTKHDRRSGDRRRVRSRVCARTNRHTPRVGLGRHRHRAASGDRNRHDVLGRRQTWSGRCPPSRLAALRRGVTPRSGVHASENVCAGELGISVTDTPNGLALAVGARNGTQPFAP